MLRQLDRWLARQGRLFIGAVALAQLAAIEFVDLRGPHELNLLPVHWAPVAFAVWYGGFGMGTAVTALAVAVSTADHLSTWPRPYDVWSMALDGAVRGLSFVALVVALDLLRSTYRREEAIRREATQAAETLRSETLFVMSRDINNAATALAAAVAVKKANEQGSSGSWAPVDALIESLQKSSLRFIEQARLAPHRSTLPLQRVDLMETLQAVVELYRLGLSEGRLSVEVRAPDPRPTVWADAGALSLILSHILAEAARRAGRDSVIGAAVERSGGLQPRVRVELSGTVRSELPPDGEHLRLATDLLRLHNSFFDADESGGRFRLSFTLIEATTKGAA